MHTAPRVSTASKHLGSSRGWHHKCCRDSLLQPGVNVPREMPERPPNPFMLFCRDIKDEVCRHPTIPPYCVVLYSSSSLALPNPQLTVQCCEPSRTIVGAPPGQAESH